MVTIRNNNLAETINYSSFQFAHKNAVIEVPEGVPYTNLFNLLYKLKQSDAGTYQKTAAIAQCVVSLNKGLSICTLVSKVQIHQKNDLGLPLTKAEIRKVCAMIMNQVQDLEPEPNASVRYITNTSCELDAWKRVSLITRYRIKKQIPNEKPLVAFVHGLIDAGVLNPLHANARLLLNNTRFAKRIIELSFEDFLEEVVNERQRALGRLTEMKITKLSQVEVQITRNVA